MCDFGLQPLVYFLFFSLCFLPYFPIINLKLYILSGALALAAAARVATKSDYKLFKKILYCEVVMPIP